MITAAEINEQSFSIDRKGYDVDEVDVFLERVADGIDELNNEIARLENELAGVQDDDWVPAGAHFAAPEYEEEPVAEEEEVYEEEVYYDDEIIAEKDARIAELEAEIEDLQQQLAECKNDGNAIAQALIIAQRSADEIVANAKSQAAQAIQDAEDEADHIMSRAENERLKVVDSIKKLEDEREETRGSYQNLLRDLITDASRKLADLGIAGEFVELAEEEAIEEEPEPEFDPSPYQAPIRTEQPVASYVTPQAEASVAVAATPNPAPFEKDLSGFGDAAADFEFEDDLD